METDRVQAQGVPSRDEVSSRMRTYLDSKRFHETGFIATARLVRQVASDIGHREWADDESHWIWQLVHEMVRKYQEEHA